MLRLFGLGFALLCCTGLRLPKGRVLQKFQAFFMVLCLRKTVEKMKKALFAITTILGMLLTTNLCSAQELAKEVRNDFCKNALIESKYGSDSFKAIMYNAARNTGATTYEQLVKSIESVCTNIPLQEEFFKTIYDMCRGNRDLLFGQFHSIGLKAENVSALADYLIEKYEIKRTVKPQTTK